MHSFEIHREDDGAHRLKVKKYKIDNLGDRYLVVEVRCETHDMNPVVSIGQHRAIVGGCLKQKLKWVDIKPLKSDCEPVLEAIEEGGVRLLCKTHGMSLVRFMPEEVYFVLSSCIRDDSMTVSLSDRCPATKEVRCEKEEGHGGRHGIMSRDVEWGD